MDTWKQFQDLVNARFFDRQWVFRGQSQCDWRLETSLERAVVRYREGEPDGSYPVSHPNKFEPQLLQDFQRRANYYIPDVPADGERLEWLALMQHYGVPTRLLDWTISPYVALYFALEKSVLNSDCAVWVVDSNWVTKRTRETLSSHDPPFPGSADLGTFVRYLNSILENRDDNSPRVIVRAEPMNTNDRVAAQQAVFLCDVGYYETFDITLMRMIYSSQPDSPTVFKIAVNTAERSSMLGGLRRMNIHAASLFPGFDGFTRSLRLQLQVHIDELFPWRIGERPF